MLKEVKRYNCEFCKKDFKTPDKHKCKFDPKLKNCFTCKHFVEWETNFGGDDYSFGLEWDLNCVKELEYTLADVKQDGYNLQCKEWEAK